jgi:amino acid adenylation domain-containing protein
MDWDCSVVDAVRRNVEVHGAAVHYEFLAESGATATKLGIAELDARARAVAVALARRARPGSRVLLLYPPGEHFVVGFLGSLYAGMVAVPVYPPDPTSLDRTMPRLRAVARDSDASIVLSTRLVEAFATELFAHAPELAKLPWLSTEDAMDEDADGWRPPALGADAVALLQYTSGSTGTPRGVVVTHGNLVANGRSIADNFGLTGDDINVSWLPFYHDMGLLGGVLQPLLSGISTILMSPLDFLRRPLRWLETISARGATASGGPNFAFDLCVNKSTDADRAGLDLSTWRVAFCGAEPIRHRTMTRFAEAFAPSGFDPSALLPCYGLAEATLFVSGAGRGNGARRLVVDRAALESGRAEESGDAGDTLVSTGQVAVGHEVAVVDPDSGVLVAPGAIGELWVRGPSVAAGYWRDEAATTATFDAHLPDGAGPFLRTGDLGFVLDGQLHITGRLKETMVVRGRNLHAHDLEETAVLASPRSRPGCGAAFSVDTEDGEQCVLLQEVAAGTPDAELPAVADAIAAAVLADYGVALHDVVLLAARSIAKTSSGKVQRLASRAAYLAGAVEGEKYRRSAVPATEGRVFAALPGAALRALAPAALVDAIESELRRYGEVEDGPATVADLNLDSLAAVELAFELEERLGVTLDAGELLRPASLRDLATVVASRLTDSEPDSEPDRESDSQPAATAATIGTANIGPLSAGQEALLFIRDLEGPDCRQNVSVSVRLAEPVDVGALTEAVRLLGARHPILTSRFGTDGGRRTHRIDGARPFELAVVPLAGAEPELRARVDECALAPFDIEQGDVARAALFTGIGAPVLVLAQHHAITDFWSVVTLLDELAAIHGAVLAGTTPRLAPAAGYEEFVRWQQEYERSARREDDERYWLDLLAGDVHAPALPYREGNAHDTGVEHHRVMVDPAVVAELEQIAAESGTTLFAVLMVAFEVLMGAHSGETEFLVGATTTGRPQARFRNTAGYFANTVPVRADLGSSATVGDLVRGTGAQLRESLTHQHFPYGTLVELLRARGNAAAAVNAAVVFERPQGAVASDVTSVVFGAGATSATLHDLTLEPFAVGELATQFDITLHAIPVEHGLLAHLLVRADRFEQGFAGELAAQYLDLLGQMGRLRDAPVRTLRLAGSTESLARADVPAREAPGVTSVHELFETTVASTPDAVALEAGGLELTYAEVEQAANRLANELRALGLRPEDTVGLCLRRSPELVIAMLAVMKSGAAFVPLDPALPPSRLADMVGDARCARILCHAATAELAGKLGTAIRVDEDRPGSDERPDLRIGDDNLAYVIFTSGSTGRPKGVQIQHRSLVSYLLSFLDAFDVAPGDRVLQFAPLTFDPCLEEIFSAWIRGATLVLRDESVVASPERFWAWCAERRLTMIDIPTAFFHVLVSALDGDVTVPPTLRTVLIGGEAAHPDKLARWFAADRAHVTLYNRWGTTETTVCSTVALLGPAAGQVASARDISIGADMTDAVIHVLDAALRPVPDGVVGEAHIGGIGVGRGYASAPRKTAARFVPDPFASTPGARLYATGDLVRRSADRELRYVGRGDQQVKVRGYRIELGEIEVVLRRHPDVAEAAVVATGGSGEAELIAAVTGDLDTEALRDWLRTRLPSYMVPTRLLVLAHIPLTSNGKVDAAALREEARAVVRTAAAPDMTATERRLAAIWCDVLGLDDLDGVGPDDEFFALGGHSLRAAGLNTRVRREFGVRPPLRMFFESVTVRAQASRIDEFLTSGTPEDGEPAPEVFEPRVSPGQQRLWFLDKLAPGSSAYVVPGVLRLYGALDRDRLRRALDLVVERHPAVQTGFREENGRPVPVVHSGLTAPYDELDRTAVAPGQREAELTRLAAEYAGRPFAVDQPPLMRATLVRFSATEHALLLAFHHIVSDGRSMQVLADDLAALYEDGGAPPAPAHDYLRWAHEEHVRLDSAAGRDGLEFWTRHLDGAPPAIDLPVDRPRPPLQTFRGDRVPLVLNAEDSALLRDLAREQQATVFMVLAACTASALSRLSGQRRVVLGVPDANRPEDGRYDDVVGFFVNTVPLCFDVPKGDTARALLDRTRATVVEAMAWKWVPFSAVVEAVAHDRDPSRSPVFQVLLDVHTGSLPSPAMSGLRAETAPLYTGTAKTDLTFEVTDDGGALTGWLEYNTDLFTQDTARRVAGLFRETAVALSRRPDERIATPGASASLARWPVTPAEDATDDATEDTTEVFATRFERVANADPDAVAVESDDRTVTYGELRRQVEHVARVLERQYDVDAGDVVAVSIEPSVEAVVAILAVQRCGAAYLPVDPAYPDGRRAFMLADSGARLLVTADLVAEALRRPPLHDRLPGVHPDSAAYLMYTSGSTGKPKGVVLSHRGLANLAGAQAECFGIGSSSRMLQFASLSFDASVWEIFPTLAAGGTLCVVGRDHALVGAELADTLAERDITVCLLPPSVLATLPGRDLPNLRTLVSGGEACRTEQVDRWQPGRRFVNAYGPTECTVVITAADCEPGQAPSLGAVLPGGIAYVLDEDLRPAVPGAVGELYVGGTGLALGYHRRPALTAERFLPDPFATVPGARMYRTGDLVRVRADGAVDYLGRADSQLKVRGFRIEPGEIEALLLARDDVSAAVVTRLDATLVAHVESAEEGLSPRVLADACAAVLPAHMVPAAFVVRRELRRLPGGKLDVRALDRPRRGDFADATATTLETGTERVVGRVWAELLDLDEIGNGDDFFALGGHSLLATSATARVCGELGRDVPLRTLFEAPVLRDYAAHCDAAAVRDTAHDIAAHSRAAAGPPSVMQERLWILEELDRGSDARTATGRYHLAGALELTGDLDEDALRLAVAALVDRHTTLRTVLAADDGVLSQQVLDHVDVPVTRTALTGATAQERRAEAIEVVARDAATPMDLTEGPLLRMRLLELDRYDVVLVLTLHHIVGDGWSMEVLKRDLAHFYARETGQASGAGLPALEVTYGQFARWQRHRLDTGELDASIAYWCKQLEHLPALTLPMARHEAGRASGRGDRVATVVRDRLRSDIERLAADSGATVFMVLAAALQVTLGRLAGQQDFAIGAPIAGRGRREVADLIGFFINSVVLRADLTGDPSFAAVLDRVRTATLDAYEHQDVPFETVVDRLAPERDLTTTPLFQVYLNMLNIPPHEVALPGLSVEEFSVPEIGTKFDLSFYVRPGESWLGLDLVYAADRFDEESMDELLAQWVRVLEQAVGDSGRAIGAMRLDTPRARAALPDPAEPLDATWYGSVVEQFERWADREPRRTAITEPGQDLTYGDLSWATAALAGVLTQHGVRKGDVVAVYGDRCASLVWAVLAVMRAGAAFAILDPSYPPDRIADCLDVAEPVAFLQLESAGTVPLAVEDALRAHEPRCRFELPTKLADVRHLVPRGAEQASAVPVGPADCAYVAFTSGSTGKPKGIRGAHGSLTHFVPWMVERFGLRDTDRYSMISGISHDPLHREVFTPLVTGACICVPLRFDVETPGRLAQWFRTLQISVSHLTPPMARLFDQLTVAPGTLPLLERVFFVGDTLTSRDVRAVARMAGSATCVNLYGSTESQRAVGYHVVPAADGTAAEDPGVTYPLGRGMKDVQLLVVNAAGELAGIGEVGEVLIRSPHVAIGYAGDDDLSAARFVPNPFGDNDSDRAYRTGDLGRYTPDGTVVPVGRADNQVKIRGYRVETDEVAHAVRAAAGVRDAIVVAREDAGGETGLVAYVVADAGAKIAGTEVKAYVRTRLPEYMVPAFVVPLEAIPLTPNRKVDRAALPAPSIVGGAQEDGPQTPVSPTEELVAGVWLDVLGASRVLPDDNFFNLGGHSLMATQVVSRIRRVFGCEIALRTLFEKQTVRELAEHIDGLAGGGSQADPIALLPRGGALPSSYGQERLWVLDLLEGDTGAYNSSTVVRLRGPLDRQALSDTLAKLVERHEALRTRLVMRDGAVRQIVEDAADVAMPLNFVDLSAERAETVEERWRDCVAAAAAHRFDLGVSPLEKATLIRIAPDDHVFVLTVHHVVADGWGLQVLVRDFALLYQADRDGTASPLPPMEVQYADWSSWQRDRVERGDFAGQLDFWCDRLRDPAPLLEFPGQRPRPATMSNRGLTVRRVIAGELIDEVRRVGREHNATLFMTLLAAFNTQLHRYGGTRDIAVATPVSTRSVEVEDVVGFFVNTIVFRNRIAGDDTFTELLERIRSTTLEAYTNQDVPFDRVVDTLQPSRDLSRSPLFQVMFVLHNAPYTEIDLGDLKLERLHTLTDTAKFDLSFDLAEERDGLHATLELNADLFDQETGEQLLDHFETLLHGIVAGPASTIAGLELRPDAEVRAQHVLSTGPAPAVGRSPAAALEHWARRTPDAQAVVDGDTVWTYRELRDVVAGFAGRLAGAVRGDEPAVLVCARRSAAHIAAAIACEEVGATYVPVTPDFPDQRIAAVLALLGDAVVVTDAGQADRLSTLAGPDRRRLVLDEVVAEPARVLGARQGHDRDRAYVIFTSGTTGEPKGVMVERAGLLNHLELMAHDLRLSERDVIAQTAGQSFDISIWQMLTGVTRGAVTVVSGDDTSRDPDALLALVRDRKVSVLQLVPGMMRALLDRAGDWTDDRDVAHLRYLIATGEELPPDLCARWLRRFPGIPVVNAYGPAECSDDTHLALLTEPPTTDRALTIGHPVAGVTSHVVAADGAVQPFGVPGELAIGGLAVGRGYLGDPRATAARFVPDPFSPAPGARLYLTGDRARLSRDGRLEFLGRFDDQLKIRGFRIEAAEVETALRELDGVTDAVVVRGADDESLVACLAGTERDAATVADALTARLPKYMIPTGYVFLDRLPRTRNGKIDRAALTGDDVVVERVRRRFEPLTGPTESLVASVFGALLGAPTVGALDNFFELGGHSLLATRLVTELSTQAGVELPLRTVFERATVRGVAEALEEMQLASLSDDERRELEALIDGVTDEEARALLASDHEGDA